jgi:hypothetical protein
MQLTMLVWRTLPETHKAAMSAFVADTSTPPAGVEVISETHGIGIGFMLVESQDIADVYAMCAGWAHLVTIEAHPVIDGSEVKELLQNQQTS